MQRNELERWAYVKPECEMISTEAEEFICTSVTHQASVSTEEEWDNDQEIDGGEIEL